MVDPHESVISYQCISCKKETPHIYLGRSLSGHKIQCKRCDFTVTLIDTKNIPQEAIKQKGAM